jgi:hypothetical protein
VKHSVKTLPIYRSQASAEVSVLIPYGGNFVILLDCCDDKSSATIAFSPLLQQSVIEFARNIQRKLQAALLPLSWIQPHPLGSFHSEKIA